MMYTEQITFYDLTIPAELRQEIAGIAIYKGDEIQTIVCGCCGGFIDPDDVQIATHIKTWHPLVEAIMGAG